jgi:ribosomal protein S27AE
MSLLSFVKGRIYLGLLHLQSLLGNRPPIGDENSYSNSSDPPSPHFTCPNCGNGKITLMHPPRWMEYLQCDYCAATFFRIDRRVYHYVLADKAPAKRSDSNLNFNNLKLQLSEFSIDLRLNKDSPSSDPNSKDALLDLFNRDRAICKGLRIEDCDAFLKSYQLFLLNS